jgi:hypothetical protein
VGTATLTNHGTIEAINGTLSLNGDITNPADGEILANTGGKVLVSKGLSVSAGLINLAGGIFDNNNHTLTSTGQISGYGSFRTGGLTNDGTATFTGGVTTVNGDVTNNGHIVVSQNQATFTGNVTNAAGGIFKTTNTTVTFAATFTNNGGYISDPSTQNFTDLVEGTTGFIQGGPGDIFNVSGNVLNTSTQNTLFDISNGAKLTLQGTVSHNFEWTGADLGPTAAGYTNNFAIGILELQAGGSMSLSDGNATPGMGVYATILMLDGGLSQIADITGNGFNIYYDPSQSANAYLNDQTYALQDGGFIEPIPEPGTWRMILAGFGLLLIWKYALKIRSRKV